ncbi:MAG: hypothetical protein WBN93_00340, partial [Acidimicrobiia bacterium]
AAELMLGRRGGTQSSAHLLHAPEAPSAALRPFGRMLAPPPPPAGEAKTPLLRRPNHVTAGVS